MIRFFGLWLSIVSLCIYDASCMANDTVQSLSGRIEIVQNKGFPRLMGMNIALDAYQLPTYQTALAKLDVVILGFYPGWNKNHTSQPIRDVVRAIKHINPNILVGQYTLLSEAWESSPQNKMFSYKSDKLDKENWWLRNTNGKKLQWTAIYNAMMINYTKWSKPDANGLRYPEWLADQDYYLYFQSIPEFDIWYFDGVISDPRIAAADWKLENINNSNTDVVIQQAVREGNENEWASAKKLAPNVLMFGNPDNDLNYPEYKNKLNAAFLEGLMGKSWSYETVAGWDVMMKLYQSVYPNLLSPKMVGFNVWGKVNDYQFFRYALASCLMDNGYFSFTDTNVGYGSVPWFDEYNVNLGMAIDTPQQVQIYMGVHMRRFEHGMALVNPTTQAVVVPVISGYRRLQGRQDQYVNNGQVVVNDVTLEPKSGLILIK